MSLAVIPQREDFFPRTRRGHGSTHPVRRVDLETGRELRKANPCVDATCSLNMPKSKNPHEDRDANLQEWCDDHGLSTKYDRPAIAMLKATGGRCN